MSCRHACPRRCSPTAPPAAHGVSQAPAGACSAQGARGSSAKHAQHTQHAQHAPATSVGISSGVVHLSEAKDHTMLVRCCRLRSAAELMACPVAGGGVGGGGLCEMHSLRALLRPTAAIGTDALEEKTMEGLFDERC